MEEGDNRMIFSDELATNLVFTLVEPAISGVYTCELVEYPSVSANISVLVEEGQGAFELQYTTSRVCATLLQSVLYLTQ